MTLDDLVRGRSILVAVGSGGVGKTTTAAALAVHAAMAGARVLVLTVDPARRLANSLGLHAFDQQEQRIPDALFARAGLALAGRLDAMMLDTKTTFDRVVERYAPNPTVRDRILANPFYLQASTALAGSHEYMAMEKLYEIQEERAGQYDLIVLDTPPSRHALDFLSAPERLTDLLDSTAFRLFMHSTRGMSRIGLAALGRDSLILRGVGRFIGADVFMDILRFLDSFSSMYDGFRTRAHHVENLLRTPAVAFVIVSGTDAASIDEGQYLYARLQAERMPFAAFLVNRVHRPCLPPEAIEAAYARLRARLAAAPALQLHGRGVLDDVGHKVVEHHRQLRRLADRDRAQLGALAGQVEPGRLLLAPHFVEDVHDLRSLARFAGAIVSA